MIPASSNIDGLEAKIVPWPKSDDDDASTSESDLSPERFILCRSRERSKKEEGITQRFEKKIEESLTRMKARCEKQARDPMKGEREIGRMLGKNSRAAKLFDVKVTKRDKNAARIEWSKVEATRDWTTLSAGCYLLRTNVADWSDEELWKAYIQLTEAEAAFRIHKSDLSIRPIWHQKEERVLAHIFVCFLAYGENKGGWNRIFVAEKRGSLCVCSFLCILCLFVARNNSTRNRSFAGHEKARKDTKESQDRDLIGNQRRDTTLCRNPSELEAWWRAPAFTKDILRMVGIRKLVFSTPFHAIMLCPQLPSRCLTSPSECEATRLIIMITVDVGPGSPFGER